MDISQKHQKKADLVVVTSANDYFFTPSKMQTERKRERERGGKKYHYEILTQEATKIGSIKKGR